MSGPLRVVHYVNQFFGGIGGEDQAHVGVTAKAGAVGPGRALEKALGGEARVASTTAGARAISARSTCSWISSTADHTGRKCRTPRPSGCPPPHPSPISRAPASRW